VNSGHAPDPPPIPELKPVGGVMPVHQKPGKAEEICWRADIRQWGYEAACALHEITEGQYHMSEDSRAVTRDGVTYAPGRKFRVTARASLTGWVSDGPSASQEWRQALKPGDVITCLGYWRHDPFYGVGWTSALAMQAGAYDVELYPQVGDVYGYHPQPGVIEPVEPEDGVHWAREALKAHDPVGHMVATAVQHHIVTGPGKPEMPEQPGEVTGVAAHAVSPWATVVEVRQDDKARRFRVTVEDY
jgi:hypothetical protein